MSDRTWAAANETTRAERLRAGVHGSTPENAYAVIGLSPGGVLSALIVLIAVAYLASALVHVAVFGGYAVPRSIVRLVDLDQENNLPTWLSSTNLLVCSVLAAFITKAKQARRDVFTYYWLGLCLIFLYLSVDEAASIHEVAINPVKKLAGETSGAFFAAWVIPAMIAVAIFAFLYLRFLFNLPRRIQALVILAGVLYVLGGIGLEMASWSYRHPRFDPQNYTASLDLTYMMINHVEELLEMLGVAIFIYALLSYIGLQKIRISLNVSRAA